MPELDRDQLAVLADDVRQAKSLLQGAQLQMAQVSGTMERARRELRNAEDYLDRRRDDLRNYVEDMR